MNAHCCPSPAGNSVNPRYRQILWAALIANSTMFLVEIAGGVVSGLVALLADAVDFFGDATNYGLSLAVLSMGLMWRARAALVKGIRMGLFGVSVLSRAGWGALEGSAPEPLIMGAIAVVTLALNVGVAIMLYAYRGGDANMRSVWPCSGYSAPAAAGLILQLPHSRGCLRFPPPKPSSAWHCENCGTGPDQTLSTAPPPASIMYRVYPLYRM